MKFDKLWFRHEDAVAMGSADKATILEFVRWSCHFKEATEQDEYNTRKFFIDGVWWMQDSNEAWQKRMPWLSIRTVRRYLDEMVKDGFLAKRMAGDIAGGRIPNFYRPITQEVKGQIDPGELEANLTIVRGQFDQGLEANLDATSLSKIQTKIQTKNPPPLSDSSLSLVKTSPKKAKARIYDEEDLALARDWLDFALKENNGVSYPSWTPEKFAETMAKIRDKTNLNHLGMREMFNFVKGSEFWTANAISPAGLLTKSKNGMLKVANILAAMRGDKKYKSLREFQQSEEACLTYDPANLPF